MKFRNEPTHYKKEKDGCNDDDDGWAEDCGFGMFQPRAAARQAERGVVPIMTNDPLNNDPLNNDPLLIAVTCGNNCHYRHWSLLIRNPHHHHHSAAAPDARHLHQPCLAIKQPTSSPFFSLSPPCDKAMSHEAIHNQPL